jgi:glutamine synthetase
MGCSASWSPGPATEDPYARGAPGLPGSLGQALERCATTVVLQQGLGETMATIFQAVKQHELSRSRAGARPAAWERREYFSRQ